MALELSKKGFIQEDLTSGCCFKRLPESVGKSPEGKKAGGCSCNTDDRLQ